MPRITSSDPRFKTLQQRIMEHFGVPTDSVKRDSVTATFVGGNAYVEVKWEGLALLDLVSYQQIVYEVFGSAAKEPKPARELYVITFGRTGLRNAYLQVEAKSYEIVRAWAFKEYGELWSNAYPWEDFTGRWNADLPNAYPAGALTKEPVVLDYEDASNV